jgi:hypothetical protein
MTSSPMAALDPAQAGCDAVFMIQDKPLRLGSIAR